MKRKWSENNIGKKFNNLTIINQFSRAGLRMVNCRCICGKKTCTRLSRVKNGFTKSCRSCGAKNKVSGYHLPYGEAAFKRVLRGYQASAKHRQLIFLLKDDEVKTLFKGNCFYCGNEPTKIFSHKELYGEFKYNGIDRLDNTKGYELNNCVSCCETCNFLKKTHSINEFILLIRRIAEHTKLYQLLP